MSAGRPREAAVVTKWMCEESTIVLLEDKRVLEKKNFKLPVPFELE